MHSTLVKLSFYDDAYKLQVKMMDEQMYLASCYTFRALTTALYNFGLGFDPKHKNKPQEYLKKPFMAEEKTLDNMTDDELNREMQKAIMAEEMWKCAEKIKGLPSAKL